MTRFSSTFTVFALLLGLLAGCAHPAAAPGGAGATTAPKRDTETVVIVGTNDLHGTILPEELKTRESPGMPQTSYQSGGIAYLASYIRALRKDFGSRLLWLDGGDEFQGSIESNLDRGATMVDALSAAGLDGAAIGNHEFDFGSGAPAPVNPAVPAPATVPVATPAAPMASEGSGPESATPNEPDLLGALKAQLERAHYPFLDANVLDRKTGGQAQLPDTRPGAMYTAGRLKIGVIGLSTQDTPKTTRAINVASLEFASLKDATLKESRKLRADGADVVVVVAHAGLFCGGGRAPIGHTVRRQKDPQGDCGPDDEIVQLLNALPAGTVDAVVAGHTHQVIHHWVAGVPVIQGGAYGRYLNLIYLTYDFAEKRLLTDRTLIEGPVPICPKVFKNQNDCNGQRPAPKGGRGPLVQTKFRGQLIEPDADVAKVIAPAVARAAQAKAEVLGEAARPIEHPRQAESELGNLVADAIRLRTGADVALVNSGGLRAPLEKGPITYGEVFRSLPFDNFVVTLQVTGAELQTILRVAESGSRGISPVSGVELTLLDPKADAPATDLNGNGHIEPWEVNRLREAKTLDGKPLDPQRNYKLATFDFLVTGGDDVGWVLQKIPVSRQTPTDLGMRDTVAQHIRDLAKAGPLNPADHPLLNRQHPRIRYELPSKKKGRRRRRSRRAK